MFWNKKPGSETKAASPVLRCSFCNKTQHDVRKLIAGPLVFICDECVEVCRDVIADATHPGASEDPLPWPADAGVIRCALCQLPVAMSDAVPVEGRGSICAACVAAVGAAAADRSQRDGR